MLIYPEPAKDPLRFNAIYMRRMVPQNTGTLDVFDAAETRLGTKILTKTDTSLDIILHPEASVPVTTGTVATAEKISMPSFSAPVKLLVCIAVILGTCWLARRIFF